MTTVGAVLEDIVSGKSTQTMERPAQEGELGILKVSAVTWGEFRPHENKAMPRDYNPGACPRPMDGDILISRANTRELVGAPVMVHGDHPNLLLSDKLLKLIPNKSLVDSRYLVRALRAPAASAHFFKSAGGSSGSMTNITQGDIRSAPIPLPPLPEQRRIAAILDQAETLRTQRRAALAQLDSLTQSLFLDMFGDPISNPRTWPVLPFEKLCTNEDYKRVPVKSSDRDARKGPYPYYGASGIIDWVDDFIFDGDRLLIGEDGANLLMRSSPIAYMARGKYWVNNHAHVIATNGKADLRFLEFFVEQIDLKPFISGSAQPKLNRSNLDRIPTVCPPLPLQQTFATRVQAIEALKAQHRAALAAQDALFASLQQRAFAGAL